MLLSSERRQEDRRIRRELDTTTTLPTIPSTLTNSPKEDSNVEGDGSFVSTYQEKFPTTTKARDPKTETFAARSDRLFGSAWASIQSTLSRLSPVKKLDQTEHENMLQLKIKQLESREREEKGQMVEYELRKERESLEEKLRRVRGERVV